MKISCFALRASARGHRTCFQLPHFAICPVKYKFFCAQARRAAFETSTNPQRWICSTRFVKTFCGKKEEEVVNHFCTVVGFCEFAETKPAADVGVSGKWCCLSAERLKTDNGTRVTATDSSQHGLFEQTAEALNDLTPGKRKPYILQITVWDGKKKKGDMRSPRMAFRPGALYEFRQIDGVSFYADIPTGRTQFDSDGGKIIEVLPPVIKRKAGRDAGKKRAKAKTQEATSSQSTVEDDDEEDVIMAAEGKSENPAVAVRTRSNGAVGA